MLTEASLIWFWGYTNRWNKLGMLKREIALFLFSIIKRATFTGPIWKKSIKDQGRRLSLIFQLNFVMNLTILSAAFQ